ncbi:MAG: protein-export chaperone SecB [Prevotellaceae bacterium]|jgi:preprotein translocase subunit SecB|nr:protein-export chaperone SecB [Prevotellaceae bacterium]
MKKFDLITEFLKGISFESPSVPELFFQQNNGQAKMDINIDIQIKGADNDIYMVDLLIKLHSLLEVDCKTVFAVESIYSGLVQAEKTENEEELKKTLLIDVPAMLFPAAKRLMEQIIMTSGFPPFKMQSIDFNALYEARQAHGIPNNRDLHESGKKLKSTKFKKGKTDILQ